MVLVGVSDVRGFRELQGLTRMFWVMGSEIGVKSLSFLSCCKRPWTFGKSFLSGPQCNSLGHERGWQGDFERPFRLMHLRTLRNLPVGA